MRNKSWIFLLLIASLLSCSSGSNDQELESDVFASLPEINVSKSKATDVNISECYFVKGDNPDHTLIYSKVEKTGVKLLIRSKLSCDFADGVYLKEAENNSKEFRFELFQKGTRLSNECECHFYYLITLKNTTQIPKRVFIGNELISESNDLMFTEKELKEIENNLTN